MAQARQHSALMFGVVKRPAWICALILSIGGPPVQGAEEAGPTLGKIWAEVPMGNPEQAGPSGYGLRPMPENAYRFEDGVYQSVVSRIKLVPPRIGNEQHVSVREAVISKRPDGAVITSHVIFIPGAFNAIPQSDSGVSAIVVTRLRDDRPKDAESVLKSWQPRSDDERRQQERDGVSHARVKTPLGEALQRVVENRTADGLFPYRTRMLKDAQLRFVGVSRFIVVDSDSFIEFSQIYPCQSQDAIQCKESALMASDRFIAGVREFLTFPKNSSQESRSKIQPGESLFQ